MTEREPCEWCGRALGRRRQQPVKGPGELLAVFVPGKLVNPLNASAWGWQKRSRLAKKWKEAVATALFEDDSPLGPRLRFAGKAPKSVHFLAHTGGRMDGDGLQAALKPVRDALVDCGVLSGDADRDGHTFHYAQRIDRAHRGVEIRVRLSAGLRGGETAREEGTS